MYGWHAFASVTTLSTRCTERLRDNVTPDADPDPISVAASFADTLERLGIPYHVGGSMEVSDRHWRDVVAIARIQGDRLDRARLDPCAERLAVSDLLARLRADVGAAP